MQSVITLIITLCVISLAFAEQAPVFVWGASSESKPSLTTIQEAEFAKLVEPLLINKTLVVFLEKDLTNKDFLCTNAGDGKSCFARLQDVGDKTFYASVENPVEALRSINSEREYDSIDDSGKLSNSLEMSKPKIIFVNFDDETQSNVRELTLKSHDLIISSVSSELGDNVFFMYTSAPSSIISKSIKRHRRQTAASEVGNAFRIGSKLLLYFTSLSIVKEKEVTALNVASMEILSENKTVLSVKLNTNASPLTFDVVLSGGYFTMTNVVYNNIKFLSSSVYAPTDFSYFCGNLTLNSLITKEQPTLHSLKWNSFQFQAPFGYTDDTTFAFGDPWHCVGFFTGGILSGLLIVSLLLAITFIGICWMMDINTMDRFDDPKGKTITINASD